MSEKSVHIVILGGGFGGVHTAMKLEKLTKRRDDIRITLISRENYFLLTPLLFEAGSGVLEARHAVNPIRLMFRKVRFMQAEVIELNLAESKVKTRLEPNEPVEVPYDHLVLAMGGVTNKNLIPGSENARNFKTLFDAISLRNHAIRLFEEADVETDAERKKRCLTFVVIGGGLVGVELLGEFTEFIDNICKDYPQINRSEVRFELIEGGDRLLMEMDESLSKYATKTLEKRGVKVHVKTRVDKIEPGKVHLPSGEIIAARTIVLSAGVTTNPLVAQLDLEKEKRGRLVVENTMRHGQIKNLWALGDCAAIPDPAGKPYPTLAQHALREARLLAKNILAAIDDKPLAPFIYQSKGTLAALGHLKGVGKIKKIKIHGFIAWWVWRTYYLMQMPGIERKLRIVIDWTVSLIFKNDIVQLDMTKRS